MLLTFAYDLVSVVIVHLARSHGNTRVAPAAPLAEIKQKSVSFNAVMQPIGT
jgi:hypothetical protein